uniref:DUF2993 domain-containing protein n=1 Tax=uncultured Chloroflexota bacterium TaxID=166587 RepID=H5S9A2_9CHLR|nr:hypothetical protein HGMM_F03B08C16 [uncultured Chloroflexota bacterium]
MVSTVAVQTLQAQLKTATVQASRSGRFTLQITQEQLTSLLHARLQQRQDVPLKDPLVLFHPDRMELYGKVQQGNFLLNLKMTIAVTVTPEGKPQFEIAEAYLGGIALPQALREGIASVLNEAYLGAIGPAATGFRLESIVISEGLMTLSGRIR